MNIDPHMWVFFNFIARKGVFIYSKKWYNMGNRRMFMRKIISFGEALVDFIPNQMTNSYIPQAGGAPANVACCAAKLGSQSYLISKIGKDYFGDLLCEEYKQTGLKFDYIYRTYAANTPLAFVHYDQLKQPKFTFYRNMTADMLLNKDEINPNWFSNAIFHMGTIGLIDSPMRFAQVKAVDLAKKNDCIISFDPNVRLNLWKKPEDCMTAVKSVITLADIIKVSDEDLTFITETQNIKEGIDALFQGSAKMIIHTKGSAGATIYTNHFEVTHDGFHVESVDTTGAGDAFMGAFLYQISTKDKQLDELTQEDVFQMLRFSNAVAALSTTKKGAISSLPSLDEVNHLLQKHK
jgi:fructokinase